MLKSAAKWFATKAAVTKSRRSPRLESLEDRSVPAVVVQDLGSTLKITGTIGSDNVSVIQRDDVNEIEVRVLGQQTRWFSSSKFSQVDVDLGNSADQFQYNVAGGGTRWDKDISVKLGAGDDWCLIDMSHNGQGNSVYLRNDVSVNVDLGAGWDDVTARFGQVTGGRLNYFANLGGGDDYSKTVMEGDLTAGADVFIGVNGGGLYESDNDEVVFEAIKDTRYGSNGKFEVQTGCELDVWLLGGAMRDTISAKIDGVLRGRVGLLLAGNAGDDEVAADVTLQDSSSGTLSGVVFGNEDNDLLKFALKRVGNTGTVTDLKVDGGDGYDRFHLATSLEVSIENCEGYYPYIPINFDPTKG